MQGKFSEKPNVFSFGVLLLEIAAEKKNTNIHDYEESLSLLGYTWKSWKENIVEEIVHPELIEPCFLIEILRCVQVGFLCLQDISDDKQTMSFVFSMLTSETATLPTPKEPFTKWVMIGLFSLHELEIVGWSMLTSLPDGLQCLTTLENLTISRFPKLRVLPKWFGRLSSLQFLMIGECEKLTSLPSKEEMGHFTKLQRLKKNCCPLLKIMCLKDCGISTYQVTQPKLHRQFHILRVGFQNGPFGSSNMPYGMYSPNSNGVATMRPSVLMLYPYDHNVTYGSNAEHLEFGFLGPLYLSGMNDDDSQLGEGSPTRFQRDSPTYSSPNQSSSFEVQRCLLINGQSKLAVKGNNSGGFSEYDECIPMVNKAVDVGWKNEVTHRIFVHYQNMNYTNLIGLESQISDEQIAHACDIKLLVKINFTSVIQVVDSSYSVLLMTHNSENVERILATDFLCLLTEQGRANVITHLRFQLDEIDDINLDDDFWVSHEQAFLHFTLLALNETILRESTQLSVTMNVEMLSTFNEHANVAIYMAQIVWEQGVVINRLESNEYEATPETMELTCPICL
ncbi:hypothetical protein GIB67_016664 [Kingdonia uniflora]|uniref:Uncharacterized protein n=1 Tax=Kingdonia uniflora TaxID=39325 RepID=A0A7J7L4A5_9MAGN|nr:hypothetical protein GIB67_016664 [Kingdonia uniflora]